MIYYLKGEIESKGKKSAVIGVAGVGYKVFCSDPVLEKLPESGQTVKLYTALCLKEETAELYGFLDEKELELFEVLNDISGIGPRTALDLSIFGSVEDLKAEIEKGGLDQRIKGVGKKKLQKILLELTGKLKEVSKKETEKPDEALDTLVSLGFPRQKAKAALSGVPAGIKETEKRIKEALKFLGKPGV